MLRRAFGVLRPPAKLTVSEWVEANVRLPNESAKPGPIRLSFTEYQRDILDAVSDPTVHTVVWQASAQVGKTTVELCVLGYYAAQNPAPMLFVQPNETLAKDFGKERLMPFIESTPCLRAVFAQAKSRDSSNTLGHKTFAGGNISLVGATAPSGLASRPKKIVLLDEVDRYPASAGTEGDPVALAVKRTTTYYDRKIVMVSTPGNAGASRIEAAYLEGDQRRFYVPCHDCSHFQTLEWERVEFDRDDDKVLLKSSVHFTCEDCGSCWNDAQRHAAVKKGEWRASAPFTGTASFKLSELYSPFVPLHQTVTNFLASKSNPERMKTWKNTSLGETWREAGEAPDDQLIYDRRDASFMLKEVPRFVAILTAGCDVQKDRLECDVWGWGAEQRRALIDHIVIDSDTATAAPWDELRKVLSQVWVGADGREFTLSRMALDCGYNTTSAYVFARANKHKVIAVKGASHFDTSRPVMGPNRVDVKLGSKTVKGGVELYTVSGPAYKSELYARLRLERSGDETPAGWVHLAGDTTLGWIQMLTAEQMQTVRLKSGATRLEWQKIRERNEALDCAVYARAAAHLLGLDTWLPERWSAATGIPIPAPRTDPESGGGAPPAPALAPRVEPVPATRVARPAPSQNTWLGRMKR